MMGENEESMRKWFLKERKDEMSNLLSALFLTLTLNCCTRCISLSVHIQMCKYVDVLNKPLAKCPAYGHLLSKQINTGTPTSQPAVMLW